MFFFLFMKNTSSPTKLDLSSCMSYYFHWSILFLKLNEVFGYRSFLLGIAIDGFRYIRLLITEILKGRFFCRRRISTQRENSSNSTEKGLNRWFESPNLRTSKGLSRKSAFDTHGGKILSWHQNYIISRSNNNSGHIRKRLNMNQQGGGGADHCTGFGSFTGSDF